MNTQTTTIDLAQAAIFCKGAITSAQTFGVSDQAMAHLAELLPGAYATAQAGIEVENAGVSAACDATEANAQAVVSAAQEADQGRG